MEEVEEEEALMDWLWGHSMEICALAVLAALTAWRVEFVVVLLLAAGWWVLQEWRVAQHRNRERA